MSSLSIPPVNSSPAPLTAPMDLTGHGPIALKVVGLLVKNMSSDGELRWPEGFCDIGGRTFSWVFMNRKEFVEFTLEKMDSPTGLFLEWKNYCKEHSQSIKKDF